MHDMRTTAIDDASVCQSVTRIRCACMAAYGGDSWRPKELFRFPHGFDAAFAQ